MSFSIRGKSGDYVLAILEAEEDEESIPEKFFKISLIDDIIGAFFNQYNITDMLENVESFAHGTVVPYIFNQVTYEATVVDYLYDIPVNHQLNVRLSHDGFQYKKIGDTHAIKRNLKYSNSNGWVVVNSDYFEKEMPQLGNLSRKLQTSVKMLYNHRMKRMDFEFRKEESRLVFKITLEHGYPKYEDKDEYWFNLRS